MKTPAGKMTPQAKGGVARAASMSPEARSLAAKTAAQARWASRPPNTQPKQNEHPMNEYEHEQAMRKLHKIPTRSVEEEQRERDEHQSGVVALAQELVRAEVENEIASKRVAIVKDRLEHERWMVRSYGYRIEMAKQNEDRARQDESNPAAAAEVAGEPPQVLQGGSATETGPKPVWAARAAHSAARVSSPSAPSSGSPRVTWTGS